MPNWMYRAYPSRAFWARTPALLSSSSQPSRGPALFSPCSWGASSDSCCISLACCLARSRYFSLSLFLSLSLLSVSTGRGLPKHLQGDDGGAL
eukprot:3939873-Rhodomonas_salina.1